MSSGREIARNENVSSMAFFKQVQLANIKAMPHTIFQLLHDNDKRLRRLDDYRFKVKHPDECR